MADLGSHRLWLDLQATQNRISPERGIGRYTAELALGLLDVEAPIAAFGLTPALPRPSFLHQRLLLAPQLRWTTARSFAEAERDGPIVYHIGSPFEHEQGPVTLFPPYVGGAPNVTAATVYDLIPYLFPDQYLLRFEQSRYYRTRMRSVAQADLLLAISEHTRTDVVRHLGVAPETVHVIGGAASDFFRLPAPDERPAELLDLVPGITRPFVLSVGGADWRKNTELLITAYAQLSAQLRKDLQLVVVCSVDAHARRLWTEHARSEGLCDDEVVLTGRVEDRVLRALYQLARLFVYPSIYEGFGLPVLEAARCGCPAITSDTSSLPEILDEPESTFPIDTPDGATTAMARGLTDDSYRAMLLDVGAHAAAHHTWSRVAHAMLDGCELAIARMPRTRRRHCPRPRLAIAGPWPPTPCGPADHLARALPELQQRFDVTVFYEGSPPEGIAGPHFHVNELGRRFDPYSFHARLLVVGNSEYHKLTRQLAIELPAVVWLHDVNLSGLELHIATRARTDEAAREFMIERLTDVYGPIIQPRTLSEPFEYASYRETGTWFAREIAARAEHLIVSSELARHMVAFDVGPNGHLPPTSVIALGAPTFAELLFEPPPEPPDPGVIVALGVVDLLKLPHLLIAAIAQLHHREATLRFVGYCPDIVREHLDRVIGAFGVRDRVIFTGRTSDEQYVQQIVEASVVVQLRGGSNGESSGTVVDALAVGRPVVTNMPGCADLPPEAVELLPLGTSAGAIAAALDGWLDDRERRLHAHAVGRAAASEWSSVDVARAIGDVLMTTV